MDLAQQLKNFRPDSAQEKADRYYILGRLSDGPVLYTRESEDAHITVSAWVISRDGSQVLMAWHNIYQSWAWLGGHADGDTDLMAVAVREVEEESGLTALEPLCRDFISLEVLPVAAHVRRGKPVPAHLHLNFTYLFRADETKTIRIKPDENSKVGWIPADQVCDYSTEPLFQTVIYPKLLRKTEKILHTEEPL